MQQLMIRPCPECWGKRVPTVIEYGFHSYPFRAFQMVQNPKNGKWSADQAKNTPLSALTCTQCGYTAWYASEPQSLLP